MSTPETQDEHVTWIGRDRPGRLPADELAQLEPLPAGPPPRRWLIPLSALVVLLVAALVAWRILHPKPVLVALADQLNIPLISVMTPGLKAVTSSVTFTGAIAARYDMPIGNDGDTGRIVAVYVEAGDHVKRGQLLAKTRRCGDGSAGQPAASLARAGAGPGGAVGRRVPARPGRRGGRRAVRRRHREAPRHRGDRCRQRQGRRRAARRKRRHA